MAKVIQAYILAIGITFVQSLFSNVWAQEPKSFQKVAIGIATPGPGVALMGHAFLLFYNSSSLMSEAVATQYNVASQPTSKAPKNKVLEIAQTVQSFFGVGKVFKVEEISGELMMNRYLQENRAVFLYEINLTPNQIQSLLQNIRRDKRKRDSKEHQDYDFLDRNCLTESLRQVNRVIEDRSLKFKFSDSESIFLNAFIKVTGSVLLYGRNAPYVAAPALAKHPLTLSVHTLAPAIVQNAKVLVELQNRTQEFGRICGRQKELFEVGLRVNMQPKIRASKGYLNYLKSIHDHCKSVAKTSSYNSVLEIIYLLTESLETKIFIESYFYE